MKQRVFVNLLLVSLLLTATGARKPSPMYQPTPRPVPKDVTLEHVHDAIERTLATRGWTLEEDDELNRTILAALYVRVHMVKVKITYDEKAIRFAYVDSENMRYKKTKQGVEKIHPKYTQWLKNVEHDLHLELLSE